MASVTARIKQIKQPYGGFLKPSSFEVIKYEDSLLLNPSENIHGSVVGMVVDYLTRMQLGAKATEAFSVSLEGASYAELLGKKGSIIIAKGFLKEIKGIDNNSVFYACKLVTFDVWKRNAISALLAKGHEYINPDQKTIENIQILVKRSLQFFDKYGPIVKEGFTFEPPKATAEDYMNLRLGIANSFGGYTSVIDSGDGDFLTKDTLWDFKVSRSKPNNKNTLQLLIYWRMGLHSGQKIYNTISKLGLFNPRANTVYLIETSKIPKDTIEKVEKEVIGYKS